MNSTRLVMYLECLEEHPWSTGIEITKRVFFRRVRMRYWGPVSCVVALFSTKAAARYMACMGGASITDYAMLYRLKNAGYVRARWREESSKILQARGGLRLREYSLTASGQQLLQQN